MQYIDNDLYNLAGIMINSAVFTSEAKLCFEKHRPGCPFTYEDYNRRPHLRDEIDKYYIDLPEDHDEYYDTVELEVSRISFPAVIPVEIIFIDSCKQFSFIVPTFNNATLFHVSSPIDSDDLSLSNNNEFLHTNLNNLPLSFHNNSLHTNIKFNNSYIQNILFNKIEQNPNNDLLRLRSNLNILRPNTYIDHSLPRSKVTPNFKIPFQRISTFTNPRLSLPFQRISIFTNPRLPLPFQRISIFTNPRLSLPFQRISIFTNPRLPLSF
jgi:hypothetical protein